MCTHIYIYIYIYVRHPRRSWWPSRRTTPTPAASRRLQRHTNGVVSNNKRYDTFGFGGIKRPF